MTSNVGKTIYGYCNGYFGRDDYETKVIVYETPLSICCRYARRDMKDYLTVANFDSEREKNNLIYEWENDGVQEEDY